MIEVCPELHRILDHLPHNHFPFDDALIPLNGIYILFEDGEIAHGTNRIVRIGTHTGKDQLRSRLKQHFILENKDRSIFRKNIGRALLNKENDPFLEKWELDLTTRAAKDNFRFQIDHEKQKQVERQVSDYIQSHFWFVAFPVPQKEDRLILESRIISTVSLCPSCRPSPNWLGLFSPKEKIRESGLWIVNELYKQPLTQLEFENLKRMIFPNE
ncbi:MAG: hypothetical protein CVU41_19085 [Chloroflexi bacterium HGW-Chloroflexi-3]|nr:MAG: hypothetical protein CVU41_19085 [Chloroflexi bacterium HGW-Chloroflexi-3]